MELIFEEHKEAIKDALASNKIAFLKDETLSIVNGFVLSPLYSEISDDAAGSATIPMVCVVGEKSGIMYFFSLKVLLPDLEFWKRDDEIKSFVEGIKGAVDDVLDN